MKADNVVSRLQPGKCCVVTSTQPDDDGRLWGKILQSTEGTEDNWVTIIDEHHGELLKRKPSSASRSAAVKMGDMVTVTKDFTSNTKPTRKLKQGQRGTVDEIDPDTGAACIDFVDHGIKLWVRPENFKYLKAQPGQEVMTVDGLLAMPFDEVMRMFPTCTLTDVARRHWGTDFPYRSELQDLVDAGMFNVGQATASRHGH